MLQKGKRKTILQCQRHNQPEQSDENEGNIKMEKYMYKNVMYL